MNTYEKFHDTLVEVVANMKAVQKQEMQQGEFLDITTNDMHILEAVGRDESRSMSAVASSLNITVGTLTIAMNNLVKKEYVKRTRSKKDGRVVLISLTKKGKRAYDHHRSFHEEFLDETLGKLDQTELDILENMLFSFNGYLKARQADN